ncbi:hypothetical protein SEEC0006_17461 [Salmonella enterica subsp. enterica serovar Choleraesuis str. 0006]|nr:hypothetical protein SEEC0006_17461 [Salmonella enterica subsp. enterica serovar Choleraesuis str. 0006]
MVVFTDRINLVDITGLHQCRKCFIQHPFRKETVTIFGGVTYDLWADMFTGPL